MNLTEIKEFLDKVADGAGRDEALRGAFLEVGQTMGEILELLKEQGPQNARAIADALRGVKFTAQVQSEMKAPEVRIDVKPTPVEVKVAPAVVNVPAPVVHVMPGEKSSGWAFEFDTTQAGVLKGTARRL